MNIQDIGFVALLSMTPIIEQRGAIPYAIFILHMNPLLAFTVAFIASIIPTPFIFYMFEPILKLLKKIKFLAKITNYIEHKIEKNKPKFEKYEEIGLITFIGIPLPTTGIWTGTAIAAFLKLDFKKTLLCAVIGGFISALLIVSACVFLPSFAHTIF